VVIAAAGPGVLPGLREYEKLIAAGPDGIYKLKPLKRTTTTTTATTTTTTATNGSNGKGGPGKENEEASKGASQPAPKGKSFFVPGPADGADPSRVDTLSDEELDDMSKVHTHHTHTRTHTHTHTRTLPAVPGGICFGSCGHPRHHSTPV